jgi:hypothetical protein
MNELEFKRHLKDLAHGHHHPEDHDWRESSGAAAKAKSGIQKEAKRRPQKRTAKKKS